MITIQENVPMRDHVWYKIGGPARFFIVAETIADLRDALAFADERALPVFILGSGTNLLVNDNGFSGVVIKPEILGIERDGNTITAGAGELMSACVDASAEHGLAGLEWAGGLPGTVGGAVRGNAGAFGGETKDAIESVESLNTKTGNVRTWNREECRFGYRASVFKEHDGETVIVRATFTLTPGDPQAIHAAIEDKIAFRKDRHPLEYPNIGSIFKNIPVSKIDSRLIAAMHAPVKNDPFPVVPVAFLIAEAGLKGVRHGGAEISTKHPNFIVNIEHATADDVHALIAHVKQTLHEKFSVTIEQEVMDV